VLPQRHDVLAPTKLPIAVHVDEDVEVQVADFPRVVVELRHVLNLVLPPLVHQVHKDQRVLVDVVEEVAETGPDGHGDVLHGAGAEPRGRGEAEAL